MTTTIRLAMVFSIMAVSQRAEARELETTIPLLPMLYRHAACVFQQNDQGAGAQIESCAVVRTELEAEAEGVLDRFHRSQSLLRRRELVRGLDLVEIEAREAETTNKTIPPVVLAYLDCMAQSVIESDSYQSGIAVDYLPILKDCRDGTGIHEAAREDGDIKYLYHRFRQYDRTLDPSPNVWPTFKLDDGFFNLRRLSSNDE